ncbi:DUF4269 domain-containing protein [Maribacter sp. MMG018]|nr:DUF4269 domain-containing protein [Maribacter sp. MMG018]
MKNFRNIEYLKRGNERQKLAFSEIKKHKIFEILEKYDPILTGTIPIGIDTPESDLDIICECKDHFEFTRYLTKQFFEKKDFKVYSKKQNGIESTVAEFKTDNFVFEIFGQNIPTEKQNAYRHMVIENHILNQKGTDFKQRIQKLKADGIKTEPAFAKLLGLKGDPYTELLTLEKNL